MKEIEIKILDIDREAVEARLAELNAEKTFEGELHALFFDFPEPTIIPKGDVLRLRKEGDQLVLAYKTHISRDGAKIMEEQEVQVSDMETTRGILEALGLVCIKETYKFRTEYHCGEASVVLDDYQGDLAKIPLFLEIEAPSKEILYALAEKLGFSPETCKNWSTNDLVKHYFC